MKFTSFSILLALCAFQVDFALSSVDSRRQDLTNLLSRADNLIKVITEFNSEVSLNIVKISNSTFSALDHENAKILSEDDDLIDVNSCLDDAVTALGEVSTLDCASFRQCQHQATPEIEKILSEITEIVKDIQEIRTLIITSRDVTCQNYTSDYAKELCLYCKIPQYVISVNSYTTKIEIFKKRTTKTIQKIISSVSSCHTVATEEAEKKIDAIKIDITTCFTNLCEAVTSSDPPVN